MKTRTTSQFVSAAVGLLLPAAVWAQDLGDQSNIGDLDKGTIGSSSSSEISNSGSIPPGSSNGSYSSGGTFSNGSSQSSSSSSSQPGTFSGGIMVQDGAAYVIHRLQNEMSLPDGSKIEPNGTIKQSDGSMRSLSSGQILTLDGRVMSAPFGKSSSSSSTSGSSGLFNSSSTPGASTSTNPGEQSNSSSGLPPSNSNPSSNGLGGSNSNTLNNGSTSPSPADQSDGSGLAPGATSTDPTQDYSD